MGGNQKRPHRLALLLAVGALWGLVGAADAVPPTPRAPIPASEFTPLVIASPRTDPKSEATVQDRSTPPPDPGDVVLDQPWPEVRPQLPSQSPRRVPQPKPRTETPRPPRSRPHQGSDGTVRGTATWYCWPAYPSRCTAGYPSNGAYAAAGPELRRALGHWRGRSVYVNGVRVTLIDWCACGGDHVIDVYHATWLRIPHPSSAVITW